MALFCIQLVILKAEFCLDRKKNNLCFYQTNVKDAKAQLCSALENGENIKDATVIFYMQINLYWQILDYWKNDHKITSFSTTGMEFTWNGRSLEQSIPNTPLFPLKTPNEIGKAQKSLPLGFIPVVREGFSSGHIKQNLFLCATLTGSGIQSWDL